jgi:haloacetate dehalogenase
VTTARAAGPAFGQRRQPGDQDVERLSARVVVPDEAAGRKIKCPIHALWGGKGTVGTQWDVLATWRAKCTGPVTGRAFDCGHFLQEERPDELLTELRQFLN